MTQETKPIFNSAVYNPYLLMLYRSVKKIIKYGFYIVLLYFAFEAFMAWE